MQIKLFKFKKNFKKKNLQLNPGLYWKLTVCLTLILISASFIFGYYLFNKTKAESTVPVENIDKKQVLEKEKLEKVLEYFSMREKQSAEILNFPAPVVDPSL